MSNIRGGISLSDEQARIVDNVSSSGRLTVVSAGAGSGKTRTMVSTVLDLIQNNRGTINIDDFALITFTNKATDEMRERLEHGVNELIKHAVINNNEGERQYWFEQKERLSSMFIGTIHGFCSMLLRTFGFSELIPHETEILVARRHFLKSLKETLDEAMQDPMTEILFRPHQVNWMIFEMSDQIEHWYEQIRGIGRGLEEVYQQTLNQPIDDEKPYRVAIAKVLYLLDRKYSELKQSLGGLDPNDLLHKAAKIMDQNSQRIGELLAKRFKYLFVDEFQDTDRLQKRIIEKLIPYLSHTLVVGDRKQAIYAFRGADDSIIELIAAENHVPILTLNASRRPTNPLSEAQRALFKNMGIRYKVMRELPTTPSDAHLPNDNLVPFRYDHIFSKSKDQWIDYVIDQVEGYVRQSMHDPDPKKGIRQVEYKDICVLFRSNGQMGAYEEAFKEAGIPVLTDIGGGFFRKREIVYCYYMLQAIIKYRDDVSLDLALGTPFLPFRAPVHAYRQNGQVSPLCDWFESTQECRDWYEGIKEIRNRMKIDLVPHLLTKMFEFTRIREFYKSEGNGQAIANLEKLITWSREQMDSEALTLQQFFDRMQLAMLTDEKMDEADAGEEDELNIPNAVRFSTIHSSKGLEYKIVIIPEIQRKLLNDDKTPTFFDIEVDHWGLDMMLPGGRGRSPRYEEWLERYRNSLLEEEARVFYVAVTRAQHVIHLISGGERLIKNDFPSEWWSWKDEILQAYSALEILGNAKVSLPIISRR